MNEYVISCILNHCNGAATNGSLIKWLAQDGITVTLVPVDSEDAMIFTSIYDAGNYWNVHCDEYINKYDIAKVNICIKDCYLPVTELPFKPYVVPTLNCNTKYLLAACYGDKEIVWGYLDKAFNSWYIANTTQIETVFDCEADARNYFNNHRTEIKHWFGRHLLKVEVVKIGVSFISTLM